MQIIPISNWSAASGATVPHVPCACGVAIGPNSDEGLISINGSLLQAGRVLPIRGDYTISKVRGVDPGGLLAVIAELELLVFESPAELAGSFARPNAVYPFPLFYTPNSIPDDPQIAVPFVGRSQCLFQLVPGASDAFSYAVVGTRWSQAAQGIWQAVLHQGTDVVADSFGSYSFYVGGGGDERENWDVIQVYVWSDLEISVAGEAVAIGELT